MITGDILLVDDEEQIRRLLRITLKTEGLIVRESYNGKSALQALDEKLPDLILLDLGLGDINGQDLLRSIRSRSSVPVIILSVQNSEEEIIKALDNGANDYLVKPFRTGELMARIRACLRKGGKDGTTEKIKAGNLFIDIDNRLIRKNNDPVKLTSTEFNLLALLVRNEGKVLTHQFLLRAVWGPGYIEQSQYLRVYIAQLRKKIEDSPDEPVHIVTESGLGYRFIAGHEN